MHVRRDAMSLPIMCDHLLLYLETVETTRESNMLLQFVVFVWQVTLYMSGWLSVESVCLALLSDDTTDIRVPGIIWPYYTSDKNQLSNFWPRILDTCKVLIVKILKPLKKLSLDKVH